MNSFISNKIFFDAETVAEQLRSARQERGLKLEKIAKELNAGKVSKALAPTREINRLVSK